MRWYRVWPRKATRRRNELSSTGRDHGLMSWPPARQDMYKVVARSLLGNVRRSRRRANTNSSDEMSFTHATLLLPLSVAMGGGCFNLFRSSKTIAQSAGSPESASAGQDPHGVANFPDFFFLSVLFSLSANWADGDECYGLYRGGKELKGFESWHRAAK